MDKRLFKHTTLCIGSVENRKIAPRPMLGVVHFLEPIDNPVCLAKLVVGKVTNDFFTLTQVGPQIFGLAINIVRDDGVCRIQNGLRAAIVLRQHNCCYFGKRIFKLHDVPKVSSAKAIHTLVGVAHHTHIVVQSTQQQHDLVLRHVGILIFVNQNMLKTLLVCAQYVGVLAKQPHRVGQQVIKVHRASAL